VRDPEAHRDAVCRVIQAAEPLGWVACGLVGSPITGPAGNHEYLLWLRDSALKKSCSADVHPAEPIPLVDEQEVARVVKVTLADLPG
jgi:23S rRNA (cytidine1920-2'-O)/16S rRNA (cytidine1409-2'-O)-methyltransferase